MSKTPYNYYDELRRNDEIINESTESYNFTKFAKQFQPRYETEKRYADYERFFNDRIVHKPQKKRCESKTIVRRYRRRSGYNRLLEAMKLIFKSKQS